MNRLKQLEALGQSVWLDYIRRDLITSGELQRLIEEDGVSGITSNPTIFHKAIIESGDYDEALRSLVQADAETDARACFERLEVQDIQMAADILRPVYDRTEGEDGFASIEVSPHLAYDTIGSIAQAHRLWNEVNRPNVMVKIPASPQGMQAIEALIADGINVNVTLIFSLAQYESAAEAYLQGLQQNSDPHGVSSVASFFVSRVDTAVDRVLTEIGTREALALRGKIGIANAALAYLRFKEIFFGPGFKLLRQKGARLQRPLWASTGTKNPAYSDVLYVEELIGAHTINSIPPATLQAFRDHGHVSARLEGAEKRAEDAVGALIRMGVSLISIAQTLLVEGVDSFARSFDEVTAAIEEKRKRFLAGRAA